MLGIVWRISSNTSRHVAVVPVEAEPVRDLLDDPQVLPRIARRIDRLAAHLHQPVGVGEGAGLLGKRAGREDHVGQVRRFGQEDVLHDQMIERGQRFARMVRVGVRHRRVLAHHVHAADLPVLIACMTSTTVKPGLSSSVPAGSSQALLEALRAPPASDTRW